MFGMLTPMMAVLVVELRSVLDNPANIIDPADRERIGKIIVASIETAEEYGTPEAELIRIGHQLGAG
jgi:hypothetical protein